MYIIFGMPGTGKTSYCKHYGNFIELDLGSDKLSDKQLSKLRQFTHHLVSKVNADYVSSYPLYFNLDDLASQDVSIYVAIPKLEDKEMIISRVKERGDDDFAKVYEEKFEEWRADWIKKFKKFRSYKNFEFGTMFHNNGTFSVSDGSNVKPSK